MTLYTSISHLLGLLRGNMEVLQRAAGAPLLLAEPFTSWPDLPARRLLLRGRPVVYLYGDLAAKPRPFRS